MHLTHMDRRVKALRAARQLAVHDGHCVLTSNKHGAGMSRTVSYNDRRRGKTKSKNDRMRLQDEDFKIAPN